jgi:hypothetical protein
MRSWQSRSAALRALPAVLGCIALVSAANEARSQAVTYQYAAKYLCGTVTGKAGTPGYGIVAPGTYFTSVNVHNPNSQAVEFRKKFAVALPNENPEGRISPLVNASLKPDAAFEIECADILGHFQPPATGPSKGFVVLLSPAPLDVVAVYTAAAAAAGPIVTMFMERVPKD